MKITTLLYLIPLAALLTGCNGIKDDYFPGTYAFNADTIKDSITLNKDYTYRHKFIDSLNKTYINTGRWHMNFNKTVMVLDSFSFYNNHGQLSHDTWNAFVEFDKGIKIIYSSDDDIYYFKRRK